MDTGIIAAAGALVGALVAAGSLAALGAIAASASAAVAAGEATAGAAGASGPPRTLWAFFVRAWRPFCGWMIGALLVRSVAVPMVQLLRGDAVEPTDWTALTAMAAVLFVTRTYERAKGIA